MVHKSADSIQLREIRELTNRFSSAQINSCLQLAVESKPNPCYSGDEIEHVMNVLAKANFVRGQVEKGASLADAIRELGKRIRAAQGR